MKDTTIALLVAGRALDSYLVTFGALERLREVASTIPGLAVIVATDEAAHSSKAPGESIYARVVIGYVAAARRRGGTRARYYLDRKSRASCLDRHDSSAQQ